MGPREVQEALREMAGITQQANAHKQETLRKEAERLTREGKAVTFRSNFPKSPPPPGLAYSVNFARFHRDGPFAVQVRD